MTRALASFLIASASGCSVFEAPIDDASVGENPVGGDDGGGKDADTDSGVVEDAQVVDTAVQDTAVQTDTGAPQADTGTDTGVEVDAGYDAGPPSCALTTVNVMDECTGDIVINEIDGSGEDFVEIYNRGTTPVNLSQWLITDDSGGSPDVAEGAIFPDQTVLEPKRFLYVWANLSPEPGGNPGKLFDTCIPTTPPPCLHSEWGVTAGGERLYLLNSALTVVCAVNYPSAIFGGEAFGRIPDGSSQLCPTMPTAGDVNVRSTLR